MDPFRYSSRVGTQFNLLLRNRFFDKKAQNDSRKLAGMFLIKKSIGPSSARYPTNTSAWEPSGVW